LVERSETVPQTAAMSSTEAAKPEVFTVFFLKV
jgi:hypothetical protein